MRVNSPRLDELLNVELKVLDKGFIRVVEYMGNDSSIVQSARVSYGEGTKTKRKDEGLIAYLIRHKHTTPFEMCEIKLHVKAPMFVTRQWLRHRTASVNEYSARYSVMKDEFYVPNAENIRSQGSSNKQSSGESLSWVIAEEIIRDMKLINYDLYKKYEEFISMGMSREQARMILPANIYTEFYWKIDLHNLINFVNLRSSEDSQWEIRQYAIKIKNILRKWVPYVYNYQYEIWK